MLPPLVMLTIKNRGGHNLVGGREPNAWLPSSLGLCVLALALLAGCTPAGPRALIEGKRLVDEGNYPQAIQMLKTATTLLGGTNALAWNYLGVAYQHNGDLVEAGRAYQRALALNRGLDEVRFNLGCLWLTENNLEAAKAEFNQLPHLSRLTIQQIAILRFLLYHHNERQLLTELKRYQQYPQRGKFSVSAGFPARQ